MPPLPGGVTLVPFHGKIVGADGVPAIGIIELQIPEALRDSENNVVVGPGRIRARLVNGEFTIQLPATDDPDISPTGWSYEVWISTDVWVDHFWMQVPVDTGGTLELADIAPATTPSEVVIYALSNHQHTLDSLSDVNVAGASNGQFLSRVNGVWVGVNGSGGGVTDHGQLTGLADDDHPQYLTNERGDNRYYEQAWVDTALAGKENAGAAATAVADHVAAANPHPVYATDADVAGKAPLVHTHTASQVTDFATAVDARIAPIVGSPPADLNTLEELATAVQARQPLDTDLTAIAALTAADDDIIQRKGGVWVTRTPAQLRNDMALGSGEPLTLPLFNVEDYGAVGDGVTDDYDAILEAWEAMLESTVGGLLFFPRPVIYRIDGSVAGRVQVTADEARAILPLPMRSRQLTKLSFGIRGVGEPYVVRTADLGSDTGQVATASVLFVDYATTFTWSATTGLPSIIGAPDADMTDPEGNTFSNLHFTIDNMIIRNSDNPSLCAVNIEQVSTCRIGSLRIDVESVLDDVPEPTHPTGAGILLPRSNNNVAIEVDKLLVEGHYTGVGMTEHIELRTAIALRCKIGAATRRICSHYGLMLHLKIEQCAFGFAGYDPAGVGPNLGVIAFQGWTGHIGFVDVEDYAYQGEQPWMYTPVNGSHIYDPLNRFNGTIGFWGRINSEPASPDGIGVGTPGGSASLYVIGASGTNSPIAVYGFDHTVAATRVLGTAPSNPAIAPPDVPTIGTATAGVQSVSTTFTPAGTGEPADDFTATAYNSSNVSVGSQDGATSPIVISGLTPGVEVTVKVKANNTAGSSAESAASNAATPTAPGGLPHDDFNRANSSTLGTAVEGGVWQGDPLGTWEIQSNQAVDTGTGTGWNPAWLPTGGTDMVVQADTVWEQREFGLVARVTDDNNLYYADVNWDSANTATGAIYYRNGGGGFTQVPTSGWQVVGLVASQAIRVKFVVDGTQLTVFFNTTPGTDNQVVTVSDGNITGGTGAGIARLAGPATTKWDDFVVSAP